MGWRTSMIKSVASLVIGVNLFVVGMLGFMISYSTAQSISQIAGTEIPDLPKLTDDKLVFNDTEYNVKKVTFALNVTRPEEEKSRYMKFVGDVEKIDLVRAQPETTLWDEIYYSSKLNDWAMGWRYQLMAWTDNGDGVFSSFDNITLADLRDPAVAQANYTVKEVATCIFVNLVEWRIFSYLYAEQPNLIDISDPVGTEWFGLYPHFGDSYRLSSWEDVNDDGILSPSDIPEFSMEAYFSPGADLKQGTPDDIYMPTLFTPEMKIFLDSLSADFDPLTEELLGLTEDTKTMAEEISLLSYLLLGMAVIGVVLMLYGLYKGFKIEKEPA